MAKKLIMKINIPTVMVSQHPDNASKPSWHTEAYIRDHDEVQECFNAFSKLGVSEYKWDWEGKFVDESVFERLVSTYPSFFHKNQLGRDKFLTFRLPDYRVHTEFRFGRALMGIISAAGLAKEIGFCSPPIFEAILSMTQSAEEIIAIQEAFIELASLKHPLYKTNLMKNLNIIPLFEDVYRIMDSATILDKYIHLHKSRFGVFPSYLRPYLARSDSALSSGIVPSVLAIKLALSKYAQFTKATGIKTFPIIGAGSLPFRGGSTPYSVRQFTKEYSGIKTMLVQSAFQYDFPQKDVLTAIGQIDRILPKSKALIISSKDEENIRKVIADFEPFYQKTVKKIGPTVYSIATYMPARRERLKHTGLLKYPREIQGVKIPRAINFTASLYSIGIPPEFIGVGRGLKAVKKHGNLSVIEKTYFNFHADLERAGHYLNKNVLSALAKKSIGWREIQEDIKIIEAYLGHRFMPETPEEKAHQVFSESIYERFTKGIEMTDLIEEAAVLRRSLG
jgi:phosphoenolpyruvate carboxylase